MLDGISLPIVAVAQKQAVSRTYRDTCSGDEAVVWMELQSAMEDGFGQCIALNRLHPLQVVLGPLAPWTAGLQEIPAPASFWGFHGKGRQQALSSGAGQRSVSPIGDDAAIARWLGRGHARRTPPPCGLVASEGHWNARRIACWETTRPSAPRAGNGVWLERLEAREARGAFLDSAVDAGTGWRWTPIRCVAGLRDALKRAQALTAARRAHVAAAAAGGRTEQPRGDDCVKLWQSRECWGAGGPVWWLCEIAGAGRRAVCVAVDSSCDRASASPLRTFVIASNRAAAHLPGSSQTTFKPKRRLPALLLLRPPAPKHHHLL
ncbi:hypothetical protein PSPO01_09845 [Paraphaeosphaeria sporulosa]